MFQTKKETTKKHAKLNRWSANHRNVSMDKAADLWDVVYLVDTDIIK